MIRLRLQLGACAASLAGLSLILSSASPGASQPHPPLRALGGPAARTLGSPSHVPMQPQGNARRRSPAYAVAPSPCPTDNQTAYFVGVKGSNIAGGAESGVVAGIDNAACDGSDIVGGGTVNVIGNNGNANSAFIGAGANNAVTANYGFVGSGAQNESSGSAAFVGAGDYGSAQGPGSFVGAGGTVYSASASKPTSGAGNVAESSDSFVGAGDLNQIGGSSGGAFIGAGGTNAVSNGYAEGNTISGGTDSFIGAGDYNSISNILAFIGSGNSNSVTADYGFIGAGYGNVVNGSGAFVGGGFAGAGGGGASFVGAGGYEYESIGKGFDTGNQALAADSFVGAGDLNQISSTGYGSFIGAGGYTSAAAGSMTASNSISSTDSFIGSGDNNQIKSGASFASIIGGNENTIAGEYASVIGGFNNAADGPYAIVAGGNSNIAKGTLTYAAGYHAEAVNNGSFVWSDYVSKSALIKDTAANQFVARASGGVYLYSNEAATSGVSLSPGSGTWASLSDRAAKDDIVPLDDASVLAKVEALPVSSWSYKSENGVRHVGPMAQDFYAAFGVGEDNRHITSIDEDGVALSAIKALGAKLERKDAQVAALAAKLDRKDAQLAALAERLAKVEAAMRH